MTWRTTARADIEAGLRSRGLWAVVVLFLVVVLALGRFVARGALLGALFETNARTLTLVLTVLFVPVVGLLVGHRALGRAHERTDNPGAVGGKTARRDLFIGTVVGRTVVLGVFLLAGFLPTFVVWFVQSGTHALYEMFVAFLAATALGSLFVAVALAISTVTASTVRAAVGEGVTLVGLYAWPLFPSLVGVSVPYSLLERFWLVFLVSDLSTTLFSLRQGELTASVLGVVVLAVLVTAPLAFGYARLKRTGLPD
jgi:ABC-2 type transport system permease protein